MSITEYPKNHHGISKKIFRVSGTIRNGLVTEYLKKIFRVSGTIRNGLISYGSNIMTHYNLESGTRIWKKIKSLQV